MIIMIIFSPHMDPGSHRTMDRTDEQRRQLGAALRTQRERHDVSIADVADRLGIPQRFLFDLEQPDVRLRRPLQGGSPPQPSRDTIIALAMEFKLTQNQADDLIMAAGYAPLWNPLRGKRKCGK